MKLQKNSVKSVSAAEFSTEISLDSIKRNNVRESAQYSPESLWKLADSIAASNGNHDPIELASVSGELRVVRGNRRAACYLQSPLKRIVGKGDNAKEETLDLSGCNVSVVLLGDLTEEDYISRVADHATIAGLTKAGKYHTVQRFVRCAVAEADIIRRTGLSKGSVQTPRKVILASCEFPEFAEKLEAQYLDGRLTAEDAGNISKALNDAKISPDDRRRIIRAILDREPATKIQYRTAKAILDTVRPIVGERLKRFIDNILDSSKPVIADDWKD